MILILKTTYREYFFLYLLAFGTFNSTESALLQEP